MCGGHVYFTLFFNFMTSKDLEILRQNKLYVTYSERAK